MAKRKDAQPWDAVFARIRGVWYSDKVYPPRATPAELDAAEAELDFRFPLSYRAFAERFGLGGSLAVAPLFGIRITVLPLSRPAASRPGTRESVAHSTRAVRGRCCGPGPLPLLYRRSGPRPSSLCGGDREVPRGARPTAEFPDVVAFAGDFDEGLGTFLFQPPEVTDADLRECRTFALNSAGALRPVAGSFWEWLEWVERNYQFPEPEEPDEEENQWPATPKPVMKPDPPGAVMRYERDWVRDKIAPARKDVRHWLSWNNHTIRRLALSIRDEGRTDTFPVLADALEEAGCTSEDLLASCRTGHPDIDGPWVLAVLLGVE